jgi:hypothetical protein
MKRPSLHKDKVNWLLEGFIGLTSGLPILWCARKELLSRINQIHY